ncbi:hypothetical protein LTR72_007546 [Exophiala xenobiotica]|uniref:Uncharacterized protein n=1 Tax=Vermiconidia calcicola TaxID=1690605 RepID=A0AAV9QJR5_9PEZI|nr:hypothetical protein LTR72_007546 [Exophiala xenobiotica]KAK5545134.1 hypothetical protein LTR25_000141 [Vermiconidia calcicola]KAK5292832.1 hypothetical protein LTR14_005181 [Exophiala xenobiotica]KAK5444548.1 hypothetical protein LTR18_004252 [Exophiala xenobiotica]KAK5484434.1 hypothetical protein LTR55_005930 [Exophiala xenobiotica]
MPASQHEEVSVFGVGKSRNTVEAIGGIFEGTPFRFVGILDTTSSEPYIFTPERLKVVLGALYPRPRCFIAGEAIEPEDNAAAVEVWQEFAKEMDIVRPLLINLREDPKGRTVEEVKKIPKEQLMVELVDHMTAHFFP